MTGLRCPICRRPHEEPRDLVSHVLEEHPDSETAANVMIELTYVEMGLSWAS